MGVGITREMTPRGFDYRNPSFKDPEEMNTMNRLRGRLREYKLLITNTINIKNDMLKHIIPMILFITTDRTTASLRNIKDQNMKTDNLMIFYKIVTLLTNIIKNTYDESEAFKRRRHAIEKHIGRNIPLSQANKLFKSWYLNKSLNCINNLVTYYGNFLNVNNVTQVLNVVNEDRRNKNKDSPLPTMIRIITQKKKIN